MTVRGWRGQRRVLCLYITSFGYDIYARENVRLYRSLLEEGTNRCVIALSSGFMTYSEQIDEYASIRLAVEQSRTTFVLVPSLDRERCVAETVHRQLRRPFGRSAAREEEVIRERFPIYVGVAAQTIETLRPVGVIVDEIVSLIRGRGDLRVPFAS